MVIEVQGERERGGQLYGYRGTGRERGGSCMVIEVQGERGAAVLCERYEECQEGSRSSRRRGDLGEEKRTQDSHLLQLLD